MESSNSNEDVDDHFMRAPDDNILESDDSQVEIAANEE